MKTALAENVKVGTAVILSEPNGEVMGVFLVPTTNIKARDLKTIDSLAFHYNQTVTYIEVGGWEGIEELKRNIKQLNGDE